MVVVFRSNLQLPFVLAKTLGHACAKPVRVQTYIQLSLTYSSDRVPALASLPQIYSASLGDGGCFVAGFWEQNSHFGLLWASNKNTLPHASSRDLASWS